MFSTILVCATVLLSMAVSSRKLEEDLDENKKTDVEMVPFINGSTKIIAKNALKISGEFRSKDEVDLQDLARQSTDKLSSKEKQFSSANSEDLTKSSTDSEDLTNSNINSEDLTNSSIDSEELTNSSIDSEDLTNSNSNSTFSNVTDEDTDLTETERSRYLEPLKRRLKIMLNVNKAEAAPKTLVLPPPLQTTAQILQADNKPSSPKQSNFFLWATNITNECSSYYYACLKFENLTSFKGKWSVYSAKLWIQSGESSNKTLLMVYRLKKSRLSSNHTKKVLKSHRFLGDIVLNDEDSSIDVSKLVRKWMDKPNNNQGLGLVLKHKAKFGDLGIRRQDLFKNESRRPFLELNLLPVKPVINNPVCKGNETSCCRKVLQVPAVDVLPSILEPTTFEFTFCTGSCSDPTLTAANNYTRMVNVLKTTVESVPDDIALCCAPTAFRPQSVLVYQNGSIGKIDIPDFMPTACGCI